MTAIAPSPTAEAKRFTEAWRTSPSAKRPGTLVPSSRARDQAAMLQLTFHCGGGPRQLADNQPRPAGFLDLPYGCRESDLGSASHSRRTAQAGVRCLGRECLAMDPTSSERSRSTEAMADVPQKPSRNHCRDGLLHYPNAHVWRSVLFFCHQPRPAEDPASQRDAKSQYALGCTAFARSMGLLESEPTQTAFRSPWQNGVAERWVGSCRRDLLDHVIILNERHLKRLMSSYLLYYHEDRTHPGLAKDTPASRPTEIRAELNARFNPLRDSAGCTIVMR
jgi:hypothetical protein